VPVILGCALLGATEPRAAPFEVTINEDSGAVCVFVSNRLVASVSGEQRYSPAFDNIRNLNVKLIDTAQANADAVYALARVKARIAAG
jgi:hypothetical protein